jgi:hypothetical protein
MLEGKGSLRRGRLYGLPEVAGNSLANFPGRDNDIAREPECLILVHFRRGPSWIGNLR